MPSHRMSDMVPEELMPLAQLELKKYQEQEVEVLEDLVVREDHADRLGQRGLEARERLDPVALLDRVLGAPAQDRVAQEDDVRARPPHRVQVQRAHLVAAVVAAGGPGRGALPATYLSPVWFSSVVRHRTERTNTKAGSTTHGLGTF